MVPSFFGRIFEALVVFFFFFRGRWHLAGGSFGFVWWKNGWLQEVRDWRGVIYHLLFHNPKQSGAFFFTDFSGYIIIYVKFQVCNPSTRTRPKDSSMHPWFIDSPGGSFVKKGISPRNMLSLKPTFFRNLPCVSKNKQLHTNIREAFQISLKRGNT